MVDGVQRRLCDPASSSPRVVTRWIDPSSLLIDLPFSLARPSLLVGSTFPPRHPGEGRGPSPCPSTARADWVPACAGTTKRVGVLHRASSFPRTRNDESMMGRDEMDRPSSLLIEPPSSSDRAPFLLDRPSLLVTPAKAGAQVRARADQVSAGAVTTESGEVRHRVRCPVRRYRSNRSIISARIQRCPGSLFCRRVQNRSTSK